MKKLLSLLTVIAIAFTLVGCSKAEEKKTTASIKSNVGEVELEIVLELYHDGEVVNKQVQKGTFTGKTLEEAENLYNSNVTVDYNELAKQDGFDYSVEKEGNSIIENLTIDFDKISTDTYNKVTGQSLDTSKKIQISYEQTVNQFKQQGFTITEE